MQFEIEIRFMQKSNIKMCLQNLVSVKNSKYSFRYVNVLDVPRAKSIHYGKKSFKFAAATLWNSLPNHFRTENSLNNAI
jgi:hypothetical protein